MNTSGARRWAAAGVLALVLLAIAPAAGAQDVTSLPRQINDVNGRIGSGDARLRAALVTLDTEDDIDLYVLSIDTTDGVPIGDYADDLATRSGLGKDEPLFVMATEDDNYYLSVTSDFPLNDDELQQVTDAAEGPFARGDYAGAAEAVSGTMAELVRPGISGALVAGGLIGAVGLTAAGVAVARLLRRRHGAGAPAVPLDQLRRDVSGRLVATDEDVRGADRELAFAQAEFGDAAVAHFAAALDQARQSMQAAFRLRQQLDDEFDEDEPTQRRMLAEIADRCDRAHETLAAQAGEFATLRDIAGRAATLVPALHQRIDSLERGVREVDTTLGQLSDAFSPAAVTPVAHVPAEVTGRIAFARNTLAGNDFGRSGQVTGEPAVPPHVQALQGASGSPAGSSAVAIRSAEIAVGEAEELLAGVARFAEQTRAAAGDLPAALAELEAGLLTAAQWPPTPALQQAISTAQAAGQRAHAIGTGDPLATLTALTQADNGLDQAVAFAMNEQARITQATDRLRRTITVAQAALGQANDLIGAHGHRIGSLARTRAAEAAQVLGEAQTQSDPGQALILAERANELAQLAVSAAQQDLAGGVGSWGGGWGGGGDSVFGGGWSSGGVARAVLGLELGWLQFW